MAGIDVRDRFRSNCGGYGDEFNVEVNRICIWAVKNYLRDNLYLT